MAEIAAAIGAATGHRFDLINNDIGHTPFSVDHTLRLSTAHARATGWVGGPDCAACLPDYIVWLLGHADEWQTAFPVFQRYGHAPFDYAAEDAALA